MDHHYGVKVKMFPDSFDGFFMKRCCKQKVKLETYHKGIMDNNVDEWYSGICGCCGEFLSHDVNTDEPLVWITKNNALAIITQTSTHNLKIINEMSQHLSSHRCVIIALPSQKIWTKRQLQRYINL